MDGFRDGGGVGVEPFVPPFASQGKQDEHGEW